MNGPWLTAEQLVGRWDPDARRYTATGWTYGPAGPASVDLTPSVRLSVDYADPNRTSEITIDAPIDGETERVARVVLGSETLGRLLDIGGHPALISEDHLSADPVPGTQRAALGRFALLVETATDPDMSATQAALASLEAAAIVEMADPELEVMLPLARQLARAGAEVVLAENLRRTGDPRLARDLAAAIRRAARVIDDDVLVRRFRRLARDLDDEMSPIASAAAAAPAKLDMAAEVAMEAAAPAARVAGRIGPPIETEGAASARLVRPTEIEVRGGDGWARVFRRQDRLLLALAPLRDRRALLVIPTGFAPTDLVVDITDDPAAARPSDQLLLVRAAVAAGREACRLERVGYPDAGRQWVESADAWDAAGSPERADTAREYAAGGRDRPGRQGRRGRSRTPQTPFLADRL